MGETAVPTDDGSGRGTTIEPTDGPAADEPIEVMQQRKLVYLARRHPGRRVRRAVRHARRRQQAVARPRPAGRHLGHPAARSASSTTPSLDLAVERIRERVDSLGVAEPEILRQGDAIVVNLPGVKNQQQAERAGQGHRPGVPPAGADRRPVQHRVRHRATRTGSHDHRPTTATTTSPAPRRRPLGGHRRTTARDHDHAPPAAPPRPHHHRRTPAPPRRRPRPVATTHRRPRSPATHDDHRRRRHAEHAARRAARVIRVRRRSRRQYLHGRARRRHRRGVPGRRHRPHHLRVGLGRHRQPARRRRRRRHVERAGRGVLQRHGRRARPASWRSCSTARSSRRRPCRPTNFTRQRADHGQLQRDRGRATWPGCSTAARCR